MQIRDISNTEDTIMEKPDTFETEEHVFDNQKILNVFRDYFDKSNKLVVDLDMVYYPSNDARIANHHVIPYPFSWSCPPLN